MESFKVCWSFPILKDQFSRLIRDKSSQQQPLNHVRLVELLPVLQYNVVSSQLVNLI